MSSSVTTILGIDRLMIVGGGGARGSEYAKAKGDSLMHEVVIERFDISRLTGKGKSRTREA